MSINFLPIDNAIFISTSAVIDADSGNPITDATITAYVTDSISGATIVSSALAHDSGGIYDGSLNLLNASPALTLNTHYYLKVSASNYALEWKKLLRAEYRPLVGAGSISIDLTPGTTGLFVVTGIPKGDGSGTYTAATAGTDFAKPGSVIIHHKAGTQTTYTASANTDVARGTALKTAVAAAVDTDTVQIGTGTYDIGNATLDLSIGGTGSVHLRGMARKATIIQHQCSFGVHGAAVHPGDASIVENMTIQATTDISADYEIGWGRNATATTPQSAFTAAVLRNVLIIGRTDCIIIDGNSDECDAEFQDCEFQSNWDCFGVGTCTQASTFTRRNCKFFTDGTNTAASGAARCTHLGACTVRDFNCEMRAINAAGSPSQTVGYETGSGTIVEVVGGSITTSASSGNVYDINKLALSSSASFRISGGTHYDPAKVNAVGGLRGFSGSAPRVLFTQTQIVSVAATNTFTTLVGTGIGSATLPANFFTVGKMVLVKAQGYCGSSTNGQQDFKIILASTSFTFPVLTPAAVGGGSGTSVGWSLEAMITCFATGSSATLMVNGKVRVSDAGLSFPTTGNIETVADLTQFAASNIDTTAAVAVNILVKQGASTTADDTTKCTNLYMTEMN